MQTFHADLVMPNGGRDYYCVEARNKTEARKIIGKIYRQDNPSSRYGFYSFSQARLIWRDGDEG